MDTFSISRVGSRTRRIFGLHALGFLILAIAGAGIPAWISEVWATPRVQDLQAAIAGGQQPTTTTYVAIFALSAAPGVVTYLCNLVLNGMIATAAWRDVEGRPADLGASFRAGLGLFLPLLLVSLLAALGITLGTLLLVIPGLILAFMWFVVAQVYAVERSGFTVAFGRSRHLTSGYRWRLVGLSLIYGVAFGAASGVVSGALAALGTTGGGTAAVLVLRLLAPVVAGFFTVVSASGLAAIYIELRRAKEGYLSHDLVEAFT